MARQTADSASNANFGTPIMRRLLCLLALITLSLSPVALAQSAFDTRASHAVILDYETGDVLFSKNGEEPMPPASMSKLMTALMVFEALEDGRFEPDTSLPVSETAWRRGGAASGSSTMFLEVNSRAEVEDLIRGIIVQSGNDACIVVAEALGGTEENFAQMMTERAHELGLESANFANATGWPDPEHRISALDLARLARHIIESYPQYYDIYSETEFTYNGIRQYNRNPLLGVFDGADGLKTGHTEESGYGLVASAEREGERRIVVFNGMESNRARADESERLMRAAFTEFSTVDLVQAGDVLGESEVYLGVAPHVELRAAEDLSFGLHRRDRDGITAELVYEAPLHAPVQEGDVIGALEVALPDGREMSIPVEAAQSVARKGAMGRAGAALARLIRGG
ncbi:D-alanyl-D-alanine carboxypeptidase family protein [Oceanicaulis sp. MMSF_3324]|uniref:D-alanyl-D-alanine carboxypeptidase family protein n=1 Tax=Oceanicaulis sp. MMSF_3324 TaxID=3046702 RepID=UPI00273E097D|nr:D-alanyl-D-alanine carboxypeptidase family protein [Oceanicaulis sp. MMSF_3324]